MKRLIVVALVGLMLAGCGGLVANAEYTLLIDQTADLSLETAKRASAGTLSPELMKAALTSQAYTWYQCQCALRNIKSDPNAFELNLK